MIIKKYNKIAFLLVLSLCFASYIFVSANNDLKDITMAYRSYTDVKPTVMVPTVIEIPLIKSNLERYDILVSDISAGIFEPSLLVMNKVSSPLRVSIVDLKLNNVISNPERISDGNETSFVELPVSGDVAGEAVITIESNSVISTDSLYLLLDNYVALPNTINIKAGSDTNIKTVLATTKVGSQSIYFPKTSASKFTIALTYSQPLRITELRFGGASTESTLYKLRFLAQPEHQYRIYFNPDRRVNAITGEMANLSDNNDVLKLAEGTVINNPNYLIADSDGDSIPDVADNCVSISNIEQVDVNSNGRGDVCDDFDKDRIINSLDNCPDLPNYNQADMDDDNIGDVCDDEESRITEKYKWLPWVGIGFAGIIVIGLFVFTALSMRKKDEVVLEDKTIN